MFGSHIPWQSKRYPYSFLFKSFPDVITFLFLPIPWSFPFILPFKDLQMLRSLQLLGPGSTRYWSLHSQSHTFHWHLYAEDAFECRPFAQISLTPTAYWIASLQWFKSTSHLTPNSTPFPFAPGCLLMIPGLLHKLKKK